MSEDVKPTRSEELRLKDRIQMAEDGHDILEKKRDGLIHEFMQVIGDARDVNEDLSQLYVEAQEKLKLAKVYDGEDSVKANALNLENEPELKTTQQNIMGVVVPEIESIEVQKHILNREYGISSSSSRIDSTAEKHEKLVEKIVEAAETQTKILKLLEEIEKTKRRVNALEHKTIPDMNSALDYVSQTLEENEREETFRMKKIKEMQDER